MQNMVQWAEERIGLEAGQIGPAAWLARLDADGAPEAVVLFHDLKEMGEGKEIEISFASDNPRRLTKGLLRDSFAYCFDQVGAAVVRAQCRAGDERVEKLLDGLGFVREGVRRRGWDGREGAVWWSMLPEECRWLPVSCEAEVN